MITQIGIVAGEIWQLLDQRKAIATSELNSILDYPDNIILMSLGWLAREGHVLLEKGKSDYTVSLRRQK